MKRVLTVALLLVVACSSGDVASTRGGVLTLNLVGATGNDGAIVVIVSGGTVSSVGAPNGYQVATNVDGAGTHVMVVGNLTAGAIATIAVPDATAASAYVATVVQVADRTSFGLLDPVRYQVTITK
jgi:hypothetical protein